MNRKERRKRMRRDMQKILCCILIILLVLSCVACTEKTLDGKSIYKVGENISMIEVARSRDFAIYVHEQTKVMYLYETRYNRGGLTVMLDENGKPLIWNQTEKEGDNNG